MQVSLHDKSHGQDARATGVAPIDPLGPANSSWRSMTSARSRYGFIETALMVSSCHDGSDLGQSPVPLNR